MSISVSKGLAEAAERAIEEMIIDGSASKSFSNGPSKFFVTEISSDLGTYYGEVPFKDKMYLIYLLPEVPA
ncbi:MAG: hypothetical protein JWM46_852 [Candidatus Kaiserbacteria bacterium]|nr:hypothetical protein [Candidatus Kaiserbacteria bacterium]